jgi:F-type H+-transporting ATPase subunit gamma
MPSLKAVRIRIASVKSTQKITRAMKLVAAARLRRAQDAIIAARPYAEALSEAVAELAARAGEDAHPMLQKRPVKRIALVTLTSDRGLAGGFNANVGRASISFVRDELAKGADAAEITLHILGRKGREFARRRKLSIGHEWAGAAGDVALNRAREIALTLTHEFAEGKVDAVYLVYNQFKSAISQKVVVTPLLPVTPAELSSEAAATDFLYEPSKQELLGLLLPLYIESQIYRALLESIASEFGARMSAMENATNSARDMIDRLTLQYNRARQASITKELMEIVGGAEALKG